jgi:tetrathionate reductase subunit B
VDPEDQVFKDPKTGQTKKMAVHATYKDPFSGAVLIDKSRCIGCGMCVDACPYGARYLNEDLDDPKADKCTFCVERLAAGEKPACVKTCITRARIFGNLSDKSSEVHKLVASGKTVRLTSKEVNIGPNVYYTGIRKDTHLLVKAYAPHDRTWENVKAPTRRDIILAAVRHFKTAV